jgi:hypothetical protein
VFTLTEVVPWGRSFEEYRRMFVLTDDDLRGRVLGCGDGPASFNAEGAVRGVRIVSSDPLYRFTPAEIRERIDATSGVVLEETRRNADAFVWRDIPSIERLGEMRRAAMQTFLTHFEQRPASGRYVGAALPWLPFAPTTFDLAVCSHFLFLYADHLTADFHVASMIEMARVAREVRVFPLVALDGMRSTQLSAVTSALKLAGLMVSVEQVPYEFQRGANEMMRVRRPWN